MKSKESGHRKTALIEALDRMHLRSRLLSVRERPRIAHGKLLTDI
jgi:hypothetical protein